MSLSLGSCSNNGLLNDILQYFAFEEYFCLLEKESKLIELHCNKIPTNSNLKISLGSE